MAHLEWLSDAGHIIAVRFDAVRTVDHHRNATVTRHPVQKGADIADHVRVELPAVSLTGYVSIAPLFTTHKIGGPKEGWAPSGSYQRIELPPPPGGAGGIGAAASALQGGVVQAGLDLLSSVTSPNSVESIVTDDPEGRVRLMHELLNEAQEKRRLVKFVDQVRAYDDMVIATVVATRTQREYGAAFQLELEAIQLVETKMVSTPLPAEPRGALAKAAGAAAAKAGANQSVDDKKRSAALTLAQSALGGVGLGGLLP
jgi:hypothetical protein